MPEKKRQHFVSQFYLRNFSAHPERRRISIYLFGPGKFVPSATIEDQAQKPYFYGKNGAEDALGKLESETAPIIAQAIADNVLPEEMSDDRLALLTFVLFQNARTPAMASRINEQTEKIAQTVAKGIPDLKDDAEDISFQDREAPLLALRLAAEILPVTLDLQWKLLGNKTSRLFITSDNPVIRYNQFPEKRTSGGSNTGLACKGLQIFLPLGPRHMLLLYDAKVYRVGGRKQFERYIEVAQEADIVALNALQAANADEVLYFSADTNTKHVEEAVHRAGAHRRHEKIVVTEHCGIGPNGQSGTLIQSSGVDLRMGLVLDFSAILSSAAGPSLPNHPVHFRNPELVRRFEADRIAGRPCDAREFVEYCRRR